MTSLLGPQSGTHDDLPRTGQADAGSFSLSDRYTRESGTVYLTGIQALVRTVRDRARLDRRQNLLTASLVSGYEGSPLAGYDLELAKRAKFLDPYDIVHRPALNEEAGATAVMGSQLARRTGTLRATANTGGAPLQGVVGYWYGKSPGLDRATDALRHANLIGTDPNGGAVVMVGDDPGAKSSTVPCASELALADLYMPTLYPADSQDVLDFGVHAALLSRTSGLLSAMKISSHVADASSTAIVDPDRILPVYGDLGTSPHVPSGQLLGSSLMELEQNQLTIRIPRALEYARLNRINRIVQRTADDRIGIVAAGKTYLDVRESLRRLGLDDDELARRGIRILKLGMVYPLERTILDEFMSGLDEVIVVEEKRDFIETMIREIHFRRPDVANVVGKTHEDGSTLFSRFGELDVDSVTRGLAQRLGKVHAISSAQAWLDGPGRPRGRIALPLATTRTPYFCSGCPHNSSTKVADGTLVGGGIGCHAMVLMMDEKQVGNVTGVTQMGGEGIQWTGMSPFLDERHMVQNVGDGTFMHSGSLALRAAVASGDNITYKLLYNGTVAMTGGQDPVGQMPLAGILNLLRAEGVGRIVVTTDDVARTRKELGGGFAGALRSRFGGRAVEVRDRADLADVQRELAAESGVTVLVHDQACATELRRARKRGKAPTPTKRIVINERICEGCGDCGEKSGCLSVQPVDTEFGRKTRIDQTTCNLDYSCIQGDCPAFTEVTVDPDARAEGSAIAGARVSSLDDADLPDPPAVHLGAGRSWNVRVTGVGGTGVVMLAAVIAAAAREDGRHVRGVDMTGLAQKGGAVVSDVRISDGALEQSGLVPAGAADLLLALDGLTSADPANLAVIDAARTTAVASSTSTPTGVMCTDVRAERPDGVALAGAIGRSAARAVTADAAAVARGLFGDATVQTTLLLGAAVQAGALPVSPAAVENALRSNGIAVAANIQAFRRGRQLVAAPEAVAAAIGKASPAPGAPAAPAWAKLLVSEVLGTPVEGGLAVELPADLRESIALRVAELKAWGDASDARRYVEDLAVLARAERGVAPRSTTLLRAAAFGLHKLAAYKDEYEVARLALDTGFLDGVADEYGETADVKILLHPPFLRALGMDRKMRMGTTARPALRALTKAKRLRGTAFDPFGRTAARRFERELRDAYRGRLLEFAAEMDAEADDVAKQKLLSDATALAALADSVRGYEDIKERSAAPLMEALGMIAPE